MRFILLVAPLLLSEMTFASESNTRSSGSRKKNKSMRSTNSGSDATYQSPPSEPNSHFRLAVNRVDEDVGTPEGIQGLLSASASNSFNIPGSGRVESHITSSAATTTTTREKNETAASSSDDSSESSDTTPSTSTRPTYRPSSTPSSAAKSSKSSLHRKKSSKVFLPESWAYYDDIIVYLVMFSVILFILIIAVKGW